jgi:predicted metal-dependent phosphoesterase TrpH
MQQKLGQHIIVGEEIGTTEGEIIGLFLRETIPGGLTPEKTVQEIKGQNGLVYIPHPFETFRKGLQLDALERIAADIDIVEVFNGRGKWRGKNELAEKFASERMLAAAASSDAHCILGLGSTFSRIRGVPMRRQIKKLLRKADLQKEYAPFLSLLCPAVNKIKNKVVV